MTFAAPESATSNAARIPSIIVLGADALLAALPATPVQLAHACALAGYQSVVPASWGDELIAAASLRAASQHGPSPLIQCSCPHVAHRLLAVGTDLRPFLLSLVAPPVVLARYLRAVSAPARFRITYVGRCPGAADESIDARLTPEELLAIFIDRRIVLEEQPCVFDSVIPPDRRRFRSQPGGLPTAEMLWSATDTATDGARSLVELYGDDLPVELAQHLLAGKPALIDCATKLGCVCSGAVAGVDPTEARARVVALEPPRTPSPVIDEQVLIDASLLLPSSPRSPIDVVAPGPHAAASASGHVGVMTRSDDTPRSARHDDVGSYGPSFAANEPTAGASPPGSRRVSPSRGIARPAAHALPTARDAGGRQLPRTYVAHRRGPARTPRSSPLIGLAPRDASRESPPAVTPPPPNGSAARDSEATEIRDALTDSTRVAAAGLSPVAEGAPAGLGAIEASVDARPAVPAHNEPEVLREPPRYAERPVALPVTPRSDVPPRLQPTPTSAGERPLMQLLTLGLLISMIVLVSAAVGVLVGRWMTQR